MFAFIRAAVIVSIALFGVGACSGEGELIVVGGNDTVNAHVEAIVAADLTGAAALPDHRVLISDQTSIIAIDLVAPPQPLGAAAPIRAATPWSGGRLLLLTDDGLRVWDGELLRSPLEDALDVATVDTLSSAGDTLWLGTSSGVQLWQDGSLYTLAVAGAPVTGPFATSGTVDGRPVTWVTDDDGVLALAVTASGVSVVDRRSIGRADALAMSAGGVVWAAASGLLYRRAGDGTWSSFEFPHPVTAVIANPLGPRPWVRTADGVFTLQASSGTRFVRISNLPADASPAGVDDSGRLIVRTAVGLERVAVDRPAVIRGLPASGLVMGAADVYIAPTASEQVIAVRATLSGNDLAVEREERAWHVYVDPGDLASGDYELVVEVEYSDAATRWAQPLAIANPTWSREIEPLFKASCAVCHGGQTGPVDLTTPEAWEMLYDRIVGQVTRDNMPLGRPPLSDREKAMIQAWGARGFPR